MSSPPLTRPQRSWLPLTPLLPLALLGCGQRTASPSAPSPTPTSINALALGPVQSAYLNALNPTVNLVPYTGKEKLDDYGMVIFDGDAYTPADVAAQPLISQALGAGKWVLGVDLSEAHKKQALQPVLHAFTCGTSAAFAMHVGYDANGRFQAQVIEPSHSETLPMRSYSVTDLNTPPKPAEAPTRPNGSSCEGGATATAQRVKADAGSPSAFAKTLLDNLARPAHLTRQGLPPGTPPDLIYANFYFTETFSKPITGSLQGHTGTQHPNYNVTRTFTVFLNNKNNPQGDFQYVLLEQDAAANPKEADEDFIAMGKRWDTDWLKGTYDDAGWFQSKMQLSLSANSKNWNLLSTSPDTVNNTTSVTTGVSFSVQFGIGPGGPSGTDSFTYSNSQARNITDWAVDNRSDNTETQWLYGSRHPVDTRYAQDCSQAIRTDGCYLGQLPNALSQTALKLYTQSVWKTPSVINDEAGFSYSTYYEMMDLGCSHNVGWNCGTGSPIAYITGYQPESTQGVTIDLGVVVPIPIQSITFSPNPVVGGNAVVGTVTLSKPAKINTTISLSSNSQNATVLPTVTVKQGETSANFQVLTSTNGLTGGSTVATIQAFYAQNYQAQLKVEADSGLPQVTALAFDPNPVSVGLPATGTVTLSKAPVADTDIPLASSSPSTVVPAKVTVKRGQTSARFQVLTNGNGLVPGGSTVVTVTAFYLRPFPAQLTISSRLEPKVSRGNSHACGLKASGAAVCWGDNTSGQASPPPGLGPVWQVSAGDEYTCALKADFTVACWGDNDYGQADVPAGLSGVTQVSAGAGTTCAVKNDGTVICWGFNVHGEVNVPAGLSGVRRVSAALSSISALKTDGTVVSWGSTDDAPPQGLSRVIDLSRYPFNNGGCALVEDGTVTCFGNNPTAPPQGLNLLQP